MNIVQEALALSTIYIQVGTPCVSIHVELGGCCGAWCSDAIDVSLPTFAILWATSWGLHLSKKGAE